MCTCKHDIEQRLLKRFKEQAPDARGHDARLTGYALILEDAGLVSKGAMPIELRAEHPLKKGGFKAKTERTNMIFNYCPFCGDAYKKPEAIHGA